MKVIGLGANEIQESGLYVLGKQIELQALNSVDCNELLKTILSTDKREDKYMTRYRPYFKVIFDDGVVSDNILSENLSFSIDNKSEAIRIGLKTAYNHKQGYLVFSGLLSANGLLEKDIALRMYKYNRANLILDKVILLAIGVLDDGNLYGIWYVPSEKGIGIEVNDITVSTVTGNKIKAEDWFRFTIKDWVKGVKIKKIENEQS